MMNVTNIREFFELWRESGGLVSSMGITFEVTPDDVHCFMEITPQMAGGLQVAHGGAVMSLLDTGLGTRALRYGFSRGMLTSTVEMKVNFLRPAIIGHTLKTSTSLIKAGKSLLVITATAVDLEDEEPVGYAVGTFNLYGSVPPLDPLHS